MDEQTSIALEKQNPWWFNKPYDTGIDRLNYYPLLKKYINTPEVLFILGARRTGKSTILFQIINLLKVYPKAILFINLDEPLFQSKAEDPNFLSNLIEEYITENNTLNKFYVFIDEVQTYNYWAQTIKTFYDLNKQIKFILTGSTSGLLKDAASTRLSGRYFITTISPLSFTEFLKFNNLSKPTILQKKQNAIIYLKYGAFPRVVLEKDEMLKQELLKNYFQTIYLKDIIYPHNLRSNKDVFDLLYFILSNIGRPISFNNIAKTLNIAADTVKEYVTYAEQAYLIYLVAKYDPSVKKQLANPRKIYCIDTGLVNSVSFKFSENKGMMLENLVFSNLIRLQKEVFYHKQNNECDFIVREGRHIVQAIQVTVSLKEETTKNREIKGILEAMNNYNLSEGIIITEDEKETLIIEGKKISMIPIYEWLEKAL